MCILVFKVLCEKVQIEIKLVCLHYRWYTPSCQHYLTISIHVCFTPSSTHQDRYGH